MFAVTLLLRMAWSTPALAGAGRACPSPLLRCLLTTAACCCGLSGIIMRGVCNLTCKCWMKGNDQPRSEGWNPTALLRRGPLSDLRRRRVSCVSCRILRGFWTFYPCGSNILADLAANPLSNMLLMKHNEHQSHAVNDADFAAHAVQDPYISLSCSDVGTRCSRVLRMNIPQL